MLHPKCKYVPWDLFWMGLSINMALIMEVASLGLVCQWFEKPCANVTIIINDWRALLTLDPDCKLLGISVLNLADWSNCILISIQDEIVTSICDRVMKEYQYIFALCLHFYNILLGLLPPCYDRIDGY